MNLRAVSVFVVLGLVSSGLLAGADLSIVDEFQRLSPSQSAGGGSGQSVLTVRAARGGYASFQISARSDKPAEYRLKIDILPAGSKLEAELYREWFHRLERDGKYYPDALIPAALPYRSRIPEPDNAIDGQTAQAFWVDVWIPASAGPGKYRVTATLESAGESAARTAEIEIIDAAIPEKDSINADHNSYGSSWIASLYPKAHEKEGDKFFTSDAFFSLIHAHHRLFYEHRGVFHQLGYGHGGKVGPEFAPALEGSGRKKHISNWSLYDRHYGPLFDGSAFRDTRRAPKPIPYVYLPVNPEWPASFLWWGEPGYKVEFENVVGEMERHFREKGWTKTNFELFFNHKKRYKAFPWDGDETRFPNDDQYFKQYHELFREAIPAETPVKFLFRADVSWAMGRQFETLAGTIDFWVAAGSLLSWYPEAIPKLKAQGDTIWHYSRIPEITDSASTVALNPLKAWMWGIDGYIHWLTVSPGNDPWFHSDGGGTALVYPGERFGIEGPIPSIRLKLQRNMIQDIDLLEAAGKKKPRDILQREIAQRFNHSKPAQWWNPHPPISEKPPYEVSNTDIDEAQQDWEKTFENIDADAWGRVRDYILGLAEAK